MTTDVLRDGTAVQVRAMQPSDADRLARFHGTLSPDTTYLRYFAFHPELSAAEVFRFTHVDHIDREAIVAVVDGEIVGVARFDRRTSATDAEVAFVVSDAWRGRGLGTLLFGDLARRARTLGIQQFTGETLARNARMLAVFAHSGLPHEFAAAAGVVEVRIHLSTEPAS
jgi:GNAT superfamily N-acetyltransferase